MPLASGKTEMWVGGGESIKAKVGSATFFIWLDEHFGVQLSRTCRLVYSRRICKPRRYVLLADCSSRSVPWVLYTLALPLFWM